MVVVQESDHGVVFFPCRNVARFRHNLLRVFEHDEVDPSLREREKTTNAAEPLQRRVLPTRFFHDLDEVSFQIVHVGPLDD